MSSMVPYDRYGRALRRSFPFDGFFDDFFTSPLVSATSDAAFQMDVEDAGDSYVISAHLAGVSRDEIDVELNEGRLSISVDKKESEETKGKNYLHKETREWSATRGVYLKDAAVEGLSAKLEDGVLTVTVPKQVEKANVTKISID
jgi:HSP20 family protein